MAEQLEHRLHQRDDERDEAEQHQPEAKRQADADQSRPAPILDGQLVGQDRDEDQIVDAEHDLHRHQRGERGPVGGIGEDGGDVGHG